jgi:regulatory protein
MTADRDLPPEDRAREICLRALDRRMYSRRELEQSLQRKGIDRETAAPVLDRLAEVGLVDDEAFARAFVASRQRTRPRGRRALEAELFKKGIAREIADRVLGDVAEEEDPVEAARRAVAAKLRSLSGRPPAEIRRKAEQFLLRRGFNYGTVREALADLGAENADTPSP